jgi:hypothetical protein
MQLCILNFSAQCLRKENWYKEKKIATSSEAVNIFDILYKLWKSAFYVQLKFDAFYPLRYVYGFISVPFHKNHANKRQWQGI